MIDDDSLIEVLERARDEAFQTSSLAQHLAHVAKVNFELAADRLHDARRRHLYT